MGFRDFARHGAGDSRFGLGRGFFFSIVEGTSVWSSIVVKGRRREGRILSQGRLRKC